MPICRETTEQWRNQEEANGQLPISLRGWPIEIYIRRFLPIKILLLKIVSLIFDEASIFFWSGHTCTLLVKRKWQKIILKSIFGKKKKSIEKGSSSTKFLSDIFVSTSLFDYYSSRSREMESS